MSIDQHDLIDYVEEKRNKGGRPPSNKIKTGPTLVEEAIEYGKTGPLIIANGTKKTYNRRGEDDDS